MTNTDHENGEIVQTVDEITAGWVYEIPAIGRTGGKAWDVGMIDNTGIYYVKANGQSGQRVGWGESPLSRDERTLRQLVEQGEVYKVRRSQRTNENR